MMHILCCKVDPVAQGNVMQYSMLMNQTLCKCSDSGAGQSFYGQERQTHIPEYVMIPVKMNIAFSRVKEIQSNQLNLHQHIIITKIHSLT